MKISTRSMYGLRALVELALASGQGPLSASIIAARQTLSVAYLEQLLHRLKKQGIVLSIRGPKGGYILSAEPARITVSSVVRILDGEQADDERPARQTAERAHRIAQAVHHCVRERLARSLDQVTLQDLCRDVEGSADELLADPYALAGSSS